MISEADIQEIIDGHRARNNELLDALRKKSVSMTEARFNEHHFWAPGRQAAAYLGKELYARGYLLTAIAPVVGSSSEERWNVEAAVHTTPADAANDETAEELTRLAAEFNAVYDGWGTHV